MYPKNLIYSIIEYKKSYPAGFWFVISGIILLIFIIGHLILYLRNLKKKRSLYSQSVKDLQKNKKHQDILVQKNKSILKNLKMWMVMFLFVSISFSIVHSYFKYIVKNNYPENPIVSKSKYIFGIDISSYQGKIDWEKVQTSKHPIKFVFVRATMGIDGKDKYFDYNWENLKKYDYIRGAYHYYRPYENFTTQFNNYSFVINKNEKNFIPVLDIEKPSAYGKENLRKGVLNWLKLAEEYYGVKPVVYTGLTFYLKNLKGYIDDYPLWIAAYSGKHRIKDIDWDFHQFTEKVYVNGIKTSVDGNDFDGSLAELKALCK